MKHGPNWKGGRMIDKEGYILVYCPHHPNARTTGYILEHRLIMEQKLNQKIPGDKVVHHLDGNPKNNSCDNLELSTQEEHSRNHRLSLTGNAERKLIPEQVKSIRKKLCNGESLRSIAKQYNVSNPTIFRIKSGQTWSWLK